MIKLKNILTKILEVICVIMFAFITIVGTLIYKAISLHECFSFKSQ